MTEPEIDYTALFRALPGMVALLTPQLVYADANEEFLRLTGRTRGQVIGHYLPDAFPELPDDPIAAIRRNVPPICSALGISAPICFGTQNRSLSALPTGQRGVSRMV